MTDKTDIWSKLSAPLPAGAIAWRQDGKAMQRDGRWVARFVAYVEANTVRERLDGVVPGDWTLNLDALPQQANEDGEPQCSFKARLTVCGVVREDVGTGRDYKAAATDAFKRVAVRFGIAHELYSYEQNWVQVDSDSKYAKPLEDPGEAYARRLARSGAKAGAVQGHSSGATGEAAAAPAPPPATPVEGPPPGYDTTAVPDADVRCPKCQGRTWDNRPTKRNPKAPDFRCRDRQCDGVVWLDSKKNGAKKGPPREAVESLDLAPVDESQAYDDTIPF